MKRLLPIGLFLLACNNDSTPPDAAAYPPPAEACGSDADGGAVCASPNGGCADKHWLYYYDNGQCHQGQCTFITKFFYCADQCVSQTMYGRAGCLNTGETAPYYGP